MTPASSTTRRLAFALLVTLTLAIVALAFTRYLNSPRWIDALWLCAALAGLALALGVALMLSHLFANLWRLATASGLATASAVTRWFMLDAISARGEAHRGIEPLQIWLAASSVVWSALALYWAVQAVSDALENPDYGRRQGLVRLVGAAAALSLSLYSLAPLWLVFGLRISVWTVAGLLGLALLAYLFDLCQRRVGRWLARRGPGDR